MKYKNTGYNRLLAGDLYYFGNYKITGLGDNTDKQTVEV
jgi:hypothetical protein